MDSKVSLKLLNKGDVNSFEYFVSLYEKRIYGLIYNIVHNHSLAEDLTQDAFVKIYQNIYKYNPEYPIEPWIFKIAYNLTLNYLKKNKIKEVEMKEELTVDDVFEDYIIESQEIETILKEIQTFKADSSVILRLRIIEDFTFDEIAEMLDTSASSVKLKFYRSRKILIKKLSKYFNEVKL